VTDRPGGDDKTAFAAELQAEAAARQVTRKGKREGGREGGREGMAGGERDYWVAMRPILS
jgi:hypothetical protein